MKRLLIFIFIITSIFCLKAQNVFQEAQTEYQNGNYLKAAELYDQEIKSHKNDGLVSAELYYNLGNAYFRMNEFSKAILNYERASLYDPSDNDIKHNLEYAQTKTEDNILTADNFFLKIWFLDIQNLTTSNSWAILSVILFILLLAAISLYCFSPVLRFKKCGFYAAIPLIILVICTNIFAYNQKSKIQNRNTAIVMAGAVSVASSPNSNSKKLFVLHSGTKVKILKLDGDWYEIEIADGNVGWLPKQTIEII